MSLKAKNVIEIPLTTGGTTSIPNGEITLPVSSMSDIIEGAATDFLITGTETLASNFVLDMATPTDNTVVDIYWKARCTSGAFTVTILDIVVPSDYHLMDFHMRLFVSGGHFEVANFNLDLTQTAQIPGDRLVAASVGTTELKGQAVSYSKIQDVAAYSVPLRASNTSGVLAALAMATNSIIARVAGDIVNLAVSTNGYVLKQTAGALGFAQVNFTELAGTLAVAQIPDKEVSLAKMASTGLLASLTSPVGTTAVTTEEVLFSYTIPANLISATGEGVRITVAGAVNANAHTKTIKVKVGGNVYATNGVTTAPDGVSWFAQVTVLRGGATAAIGEGSLVVEDTHEGVTINATGLTWANTNAVEVTGQNGTATIDDVVVNMVTVQLIR